MSDGCVRTTTATNRTDSLCQTLPTSNGNNDGDYDASNITQWEMFKLNLFKIYRSKKKKKQQKRAKYS